MMRVLLVTTMVALLAAPVLADGGGPEDIPDGILVLEPASAINCVAVRIEVPADKMLTGFRWFNGSGAISFSRVLAASGSDLFPPSLEQAVVMAENVVGEDNAWSMLAFPEPVASETGTLFFVFQYEADYSPAEGEIAHGVGYRLQEDPEFHFVSGDGERWFKIASQCNLMVEPLLSYRAPSVVALSVMRPVDTVETDAPESEEGPMLPRVLAMSVYPNPFNPELKVELSLPRASSINLKIFDIRGMLVRTLYTGQAAAGLFTVTWDGSDNRGSQVSSGVYWARLQTSGKTLTQRMVMIK